MKYRIDIELHAGYWIITSPDREGWEVRGNALSECVRDIAPMVNYMTLERLLAEQAQGEAV
jgi:hypothetical protein